ncbi:MULTISPECIES: class I SAM-dependent methyltransferase [Methylomonas]|uniref:Methyltransferase n=2 Tax=Methylomonas TaxID=416 RepID=A0A140E6J7_9GAMM|nr:MULTISPECIES: class I SAM-dependent methyltransferase [Methylomonas]AMK79021.1 methyltransferase [Methylomonas denitrificans]OAH96926.1 methyltransferase [Methylomonas methanica]TCV74241.1 2-polyprenyl-3-methyl-5-hydroxy-6-metoxy-1,4-benzoquinol methylase [Methylomonas methanica]
MPALSCPLCTSNDTRHFHSDSTRDYNRCRNCLLVYVDRSQHLSPSQEQAIYDLHQNAIDDPGYLKFLSRLANPLFDRLPANSQGLDYGCGPGPALAELFKAQGHRMNLYDPFYADFPEHLQQAYDFIVCTEVVEHFRAPKCEFDALFKLLKPGGWFGIMTKLVIDAEAFAKWHYKNDQTHIAFFSQPTFYWLATRYQCQLEFIGKDVIILQRNPGRHSD